MSECACRHNGSQLFELCGLHAHSHDDIINDLKDKLKKLKDLGLERLEWRSRMGLSTRDDIVKECDSLRAENARLKELYESACGLSEARRKDIITLENNYGKLAYKLAEVMLNPEMYTHKEICSKGVGPINECPVCKEK